MWRAIVVDASADTLRAFVVAWVTRRPTDGEALVLGSDVGLAVAPAQTLLVHGDLVAAVRDALAGPIRVVDERPIARARLDFEAEAASRAAAASIRAVMRALPDGVQMERHSEHEEEHVAAHSRDHGGPARRYAYRASGSLGGPLEDVLTVRRRLAATGVARPGALHVD